ncbi:MAG: phage tail family protein [Odoribacter sp.]|nr:phage tail family protein [Odoribacter sp.]
MKVNGIDARKYNAKQLTVEIQPPAVAVNYEWMTGALQPTEFETDVAMGHLKMCVYFRGRDRNSIIRTMSEFMANFTTACDLELDGYKGKYRGFLTTDDFEKTITNKRYKINLEFDGYFYDDEIAVTFDGVTSGSFYMVGSRKTPCIVEVYAKSALTNYVIKGMGDDDITVQSLASGETVIIDGIKGTVTISGANAFDRVSLWEFPAIKPGGTALTFSNNRARVKIRYRPMWI